MVKLSKSISISFYRSHLLTCDNRLSHRAFASIKELWIDFTWVFRDDGRSCLQILNLDKFLALGEPGMLQDLCGATSISYSLRRVLDEQFQTEVFEFRRVAAPKTSNSSLFSRPLHVHINDPLDQ